MADMLKEMDRFILTEDLPAEGLKAGDEGLVVMVHRNGEGEYTGPDGYTAEFTCGRGSAEQYHHVNVRPHQVQAVSTHASASRLV